MTFLLLLLLSMQKLTFFSAQFMNRYNNIINILTKGTAETALSTAIHCCSCIIPLPIQQRLVRELRVSLVII